MQEIKKIGYRKVWLETRNDCVVLVIQDFSTDLEKYLEPEICYIIKENDRFEKGECLINLDAAYGY